MDRQPIYLVIRRTGQFGPDGEELYIVYDVALTRGKADRVVSENPGTEVMKRYAGK